MTSQLPATVLATATAAELIKGVVDKHKLRDHLAMLVTDNAANMVLARRLVIGSDGFKHIMEMRWVLATTAIVVVPGDCTASMHAD